MAALFAATWAIATTYVYDANGRLVVVTNDAGQSARYVYDKLGNILRIDRLEADDLAIFSFSPGRGAPGVTVKVRGNGFSTTPAQNALRFNGVIASVTQATTTELTTTVPAAATTGPITVTVGTETATSPTNFVVDENARPPIITSVSPLIVTAGDAITTVGQYLNPIVGQTTVRLNQRAAIPTTLTNVQTVFPVPTNTGSGRVSVATPFGIATSVEDVVIAPIGVLAVDITVTQRLALDASPQPFSVVTPGKYAAALFDSTAGDYLSVQFSSISVSSVSYWLYEPDNRLLVSGTVSPSNPTIHLPRLRSSGTYMLLLKSASGPATWNLGVEKDKYVTNDGASPIIPTAGPDQSKRLVFTVSTGQQLGLGISDLVTPGSNNYASVSVYKDGTNTHYRSCYAQDSGCQINLSGLVAGPYTMVARPPSGGGRTLSFRATLSSDKAAVLERNVAYSLALERRGQNGRLTFGATAGETLELQITSQVTAPADREAYYTVYRPDGALLTSSVTVTQGSSLTLRNLPETGSYVLVVDPDQGETLTAQLKLATVAATAIALDGATSTFATAPSQSVYISFTAAAGANLGLGLSDLSTPGTNNPIYVEVYKPDGILSHSLYCYQSNGGCELNLSDLMSGTYNVEVRPPVGGTSMSFDATLSSDVAGILPLNSQIALSLTRRGQNARLTFAGTAGEMLALRLTSQTTMPAGKTVYYQINRPDGSFWTSLSTSASAAMLNFPANLPETGTYTVFVDPGYGETLAAQIQRIVITPTVIVSGAAESSFTTTLPGEYVYLTFTATAGANLGVGLKNLLTPGSTDNVNVQIFAPNGGLLESESCRSQNDGCQLNLSNLTAGSHSIVVRPTLTGQQKMSFNALLSSDVTIVLPRDVATPLSVARRGQNARLTFAATAGETLALKITSQATTPTGGEVSYRAYTPSGDSWSAVYVSAATGSLNLTDLPETGTYTVFVDAYYGETVVAQMLLDTTP